MENKLASFIIKGLKAVNEITENIDFKKTTVESIENQLKNNVNKQYLNIQDSRNLEEDFFSFMKKNEKPFQNIKIFIIYPAKQESLKDHIDEYFKNVQVKYKEDKMFYFYFQLILMEQFIKQFDKNLPRSELKVQLKEILKNQCLREKKTLSKCMCNLEDDSVLVMSEFGNKINQKCKIERDGLEQCIIRNINRK